MAAVLWCGSKRGLISINPSSWLRVIRRGFTLIELLLTLGIISLLVSITIAALSPSRQLATSRNAKRQADVNSILSAVYQYVVDVERLPSTIPSGTAREICATDSADCDAAINLDVLTGAYIMRIPSDPQLTDTATGTNYWIVREWGGRITVSAPGAEEGQHISITR